MDISKRKSDHVELCANGSVNYQKSTGFERYDFVHNAIPEVDFDSVDTSATLLGRTFSFPVFISSMTGGYTKAGAVNAIIAEFCEKNNLPFGVGSQRIMVEKPETARSFSIVREKAPNAFIASNIGGCQLIGGMSSNDINKIIESIRADAIIVHLNVLQELMQPEGDRHFKGIVEGIDNLVQSVTIPVIVKETGAGISGETAGKLIKMGAKVIDVAGAGGTSWAKVENLRDEENELKWAFNDWGIPTADCLVNMPSKETFGYELIASGGIRTSFDMLKSLCLGANLAGVAQPIIKAIIEEGQDGLYKLFGQWRYQFKVAMTLLGCDSIRKLSSDHLRKI